MNDDDLIYLLSNYGIGGYLYQLVDDEELPIAFVRKSLTSAQGVLFRTLVDMRYPDDAEGKESKNVSRGL